MGLALRPHTIDEFADYLNSYRHADIRATILHHTYRPNAAQWRGQSSIDAIQRYHVQQRGFRAIAANAYTAPDRRIWNARPPTWDNSAANKISRPWRQVPEDLVRIAGHDRQWLNRYGFAVETVGDFDVEDPRTSPAMATSLEILALVHRLWNLPVHHCFLHRDVAAKTCPGRRVARHWVYDELRRRLTMPEYDEWAADAVEWCRQTGIMTGRADSFAGREPVTRQELAVVLKRLYDYQREEDEPCGE